MLSYDFVDMDLVSSSTEKENDELESRITSRNLQDKLDTSQTPENFQQYELQDVSKSLASISNIKDTDKFDNISVVLQCCTLQLPMDAESCLSAANSSSEHSNCNKHYNGETEIQSDDEYNETSSVASENSLSDTDFESTCSSIPTSSGSDDSEDGNVSDSAKSTDFPTEEYQVLSLMSCFLRNK